MGSEQPSSSSGQRFQVGGQGSPVYVQVPFGQSHGLARTLTFGTSLTEKLISKIKQAYTLRGILLKMNQDWPLCFHLEQGKVEEQGRIQEF